MSTPPSTQLLTSPAIHFEKYWLVTALDEQINSFGDERWFGKGKCHLWVPRGEEGGREGRGKVKLLQVRALGFSLYRLARWLTCKSTRLPCRRHRRRGFNPWVRKIPWGREMATHSSVLTWKIPWTEEPGGLLPMGSEELGTT